MKRAMAAVMLAVALAAAGGVRADETSSQIDLADGVLNPALVLLLRSFEESDPAGTVLRLEALSATATGTSGNLDRVAEYLPLESTVRLQRLFFLKVLEAGAFDLEADAGSTDSRMVRLGWADPNRGRLEVADTRLLHRLVGRRRGIVTDFNPGDTYRLKWERIQGKAEVNLLAEAHLAAFAELDSQTRAGSRQHTFFQLHRQNCTDCHSFSAARGILEETGRYRAGLRATLAGNTYLEASAGAGGFRESSTLPIFDFGGPFGVSPVVSNLHSDETRQEFKLYTGQGEYRLGAHYLGVKRRNLSNGQLFRNRHLALKGAFQPDPAWWIRFHYTTDDREASLSRNRREGGVEVAGRPVPGLHLRARWGQTDTRYAILGRGFPTMRDRHWSVRAVVQPAEEVRLSASFRRKDVKNPFFPIDPARRNDLALSAVWSPENLVVGGRYRRVEEANDRFARRSEEATGFLTALFEGGWGVDASYSLFDLHSESGQLYSFRDIDFLTGVTTLTPVQTGLPYRSRNTALVAGVRVPLGESGWRLRPGYRRIQSRAEADWVPSFPSISRDARVDVLQEGYSLRFDLPVAEEARVGLGWEHNRWRDMGFPSNNGSYELFMFDFSAHY